MWHWDRTRRYLSLLPGPAQDFYWRRLWQLAQLIRRVDHYELVVRFHPLAGGSIAAVRRQSFEPACNDVALGEYLLGVDQSLPVYPLDGGNVSRNLLLQADPVDGVRKSLWISVIAGGLVALAGFFFFRSIYMAVLFGLLAFQSYQSLQGGLGSDA